MNGMPEFFQDIKSITMKDPLAKILGSAEDGLIIYAYADVVKLTGHSCPTTAGAYLMILKGLEKLYGAQIPIRGEVKVCIQGRLGDGVVGVIASVASFITGATADSGFHGLLGKFDRRNLLEYDANQQANILLTRVDTNQSVELYYDPSIVPPKPEMGEFLSKIAQGAAEESDKKAFAALWQDRVKRILVDFRDSEELVKAKIGNYMK
jgi:FmdE, Molybdenum formylmethanofuran dehydrogenase operon